MDAGLIGGIAGAVGGLLTGVVGSLVAPWINWRIERRKLQLQARVGLLTSAREVLSSDAYNYPAFAKSALFSQLLPHLSPACRQVLNSGKVDAPNTITIGGGARPFASANGIHIIHGGRDAGTNTQHRSRLLDEIARLEKEWGLV